MLHCKLNGQIYEYISNPFVISMLLLLRYSFQIQVFNLVIIMLKFICFCTLYNYILVQLEVPINKNKLFLYQYSYSMKYFKIQYIKQSRHNPETNQPEFLVHWKGFDSEQDQWIPFENFQFKDQIKIKKKSLKSKDDDKILQINKFIDKFANKKNKIEKEKTKNISKALKNKNKAKNQISKLNKAQVSIINHQQKIDGLCVSQIFSNKNKRENQKFNQNKQDQLHKLTKNRQARHLAENQQVQSIQQQQNYRENYQRKNKNLIEQSQLRLGFNDNCYHNNGELVDQQEIKSSKDSFEYQQNGLKFIHYFDSSQNASESLEFQDSQKLLQDYQEISDAIGYSYKDVNQDKINTRIAQAKVHPTKIVSSMSNQVLSNMNSLQSQNISKSDPLINGLSSIPQQSIYVEQDSGQTLGQFLTCRQLQAKSKQLKTKSKTLIILLQKIKESQVQLHNQMADLAKKIKKFVQRTDLFIPRHKQDHRTEAVSNTAKMNEVSQY